MPKFDFTAIDREGRRSSGSREASDRRSLVRSLSGDGLRVISLGQREPKDGGASKKAGKSVAAATRTSSREWSGRRRLNERQRMLFIQMFRRLLSGGLSTGDAVQAIGNTVGDRVVKDFSRDVWRELSDGSSFAHAMGKHGMGLSGELYELIRAGEATGRLEPVMEDVDRILEDRRTIRELLLAKLSYPVFITGVAFAVCAFLVLVLIPQVEGILTSLRVEMSLAVRFLLGISQSIFWIGPALVIIVAAFLLALVALRRTPNGLLWQDRMLFELPVFSSILKPYIGYRISRTLASLLKNGVDLTESLHLVGRTISNAHVRSGFEQARREINDGLDVATGLGQQKILDPLSIGVLATHENIGELGQGFDDIAEDSRKALDKNLNRLIKVISGVALFIAFALVALIAIGMVSAVFEVGRGIR